MKRTALILLVLLLASANASAAELFKRYYGEHEIAGTPSDIEAVRTMLEESKVPARAAADGALTRLDGEFPIDPDKRLSEAVIEFVSRHRAAFGLKDPEGELGIMIEEPAKVPFHKEQPEEQPTLSVFVQFIQRVTSPYRLRVFTIPGAILRVESDIKPTFDYVAKPSISPYEALDKAIYELGGGDESRYYPDEISIRFGRGDEDGSYEAYYIIDFTGTDHRVRVRVHAETGRILEVDDNPAVRPGG